MTILFKKLMHLRFLVREFLEQVNNYEPFKQDSVVLSLPKLQ